MQQSNKITYCIVFILALLAGCIEPYDLENITLSQPKLVIRGEITNQQGYHYLTISETTSPVDPEFVGVDYCVAYVMDQNSNIFEYDNVSGGRYRVYLDSTQLVPGNSFKLFVQDQLNAIEYESDWDTFLISAPLAEMYGARKDAEQPSGDIENGVQFYIDFSGGEGYSQYYRYEIEEMYEYHARYHIDWVYQGSVQRSSIGDSLQVCYRNVKLQDIYTLSTNGLAQNIYPGFPLQHVLENTEKLNHRYSVLLTQYAMSEASYKYWKAVQENSQQTGGLYDKQPLSIKGNIRSITDPKQSVLGHFSVVTTKQKRFFFTKKQFNLEGYDKYACIPFEDPEIGMIPPSSWPLYMVGSGGKFMRADHVCFDCRLTGGTVTKPDFW